MSKIRDLFQKLKKKKATHDEDATGEHQISFEASEMEEADDAGEAYLEVDADETSMEVDADETSVEVDADETSVEVDADETSVEVDADETPDIPVPSDEPTEVSADASSDDTGDIPPPQPEAENEEIPVMADEAQDYMDEEDFTGTVNEIDLDGGKISVKDKLHMGMTSLKDKINRFNFRKFKSMSVSEDPDAEPKKPWSKERILHATKSKVSNLDTQKLKTFHVEVFSPARRNQIHKSFQYAIIFGTVFIAGKNLALLLKGADVDPGAGSAKSMIDSSRLLTREDVNQMRNSGIFKTEAAKPVDQVKKPVIAQDIKCKSADRKSRLPIKLLNTVVLQDSVKSIASVQVRSGSELTEVREGDKINDIAKIDLIDRQKVILKNLKDGNCEFIENLEDDKRSSPIAVMSPSQSKAFKRRAMKVDGIENEGNKYTIEKSFIQDKMKNISDVLTQARGIQMTNPDGSLSFKIVDVEPGGIFSYLGIQNNDVITEINGKKISNLNEVMSLFGKISNVEKMNITVNRNGEEVPLDYNIR